MHTRNALLSHIILKLIFIQTEMDHKDGKTLPYNITVFLRLELDTSYKARRYLNHLTYMHLFFLSLELGLKNICNTLLLVLFQIYYISHYDPNYSF